MTTADYEVHPAYVALGTAMSVSELPSPSLVVDLDIFDRNVHLADDMLRGTAKVLRPHFKAHRTPDLMLRQLGRNLAGAACATVGEAEVLVESKVTDVLVANEIVTPSKIERIVALARSSRVTLAVDAIESITAVSQAANRAGAQVQVLIDVDVGLHRCGVRTPEEALALTIAAHKAPGIQLMGLMGYEGRVVPPLLRGRRTRIASSILQRTRTLLAGAGYEVPIVSGGGTSTFREAIGDPTITEIQAGTYALMEPGLAEVQLPFSCAASVIGTVISRSGNQTVLDIGRKTIGWDAGLPIGEDARVTLVSVGDEHSRFTWEGTMPPLGARLAVRPESVSSTFNLYDVVWLARGQDVVGQCAVLARGRSQ
jgi:D-serine deaminase-like pyridoxal phosphate-dependent protein